MVQRIADILTTLLKKETELLDAQNIGHPGIIGDMYEGLAREILEKALPKKLASLTVATGVIENDDRQSKQIDILIGLGPGVEIPRTQHRKYRLEDVIAVLEVKKNLYTRELTDSFDKLRSVVALGPPKRDLKAELADDAFRHIAGMPLPAAAEVENLPIHLQGVHHTIVCESAFPLRVVFGYHGYKSEDTLRKGFADFVQETESELGYGPLVFPNLIATSAGSLVKLDGMPYAAVSQDPDVWELYASYAGNPLLILLEQLFTRLDYRFETKVVPTLGELSVEPLAPFIRGHYTEVSGEPQWNLTGVLKTPTVGDGDEQEATWQPAILDICEYVVVHKLCVAGETDVTAPDFVNFISGHGYDVDQLVSGLNEKRLAYRDGNLLKLLTTQCQMAIDPELGFVAGENSDGRLIQWMLERMGRG
ncbi:MAG: DUF6602 domain-containing protein [Vulcanimicrobiota bacterium]